MKLETIKEYIAHLEFLGYSIESLEKLEDEEEDYRSVQMRSSVHGEKILTTTLPNSGYITIYSSLFVQSDYLDLVQRNRLSFFELINELNVYLPSLEKIVIVDRKDDDTVQICCINSYCQQYDRVQFGEFLSYFDNQKKRIGGVIVDFLEDLKKK